MGNVGSAAAQMGKDQWFDDLAGKQRLAITQYHEVVGFFGHLWLQHFAQLLTGISLLGTGIAQVSLADDLTTA